MINRGLIFVFGFLMTGPALGAECLNIQSLLKTIPANTPASVQVEGARVITKHGLVNLFKRDLDSFTAKPILGSSLVVSDLGKRFRSGSLVTTRFLTELKKELALNKRYAGENEGPIYFEARVMNNVQYSKGAAFLAGVLTSKAVEIPYGYTNDNTIYPEHIEQAQCAGLRPIGQSAPVFKIISSTADSLTYTSEDSGEVFTLKMEGTPQAGVMTLVRLKYFAVGEKCQAGTHYETHPVEVTYKMRWGAEAAKSGIETVISDEQGLGFAAPADKDTFCSSPYKLEEEKSFDTPLTEKMHLPVGHVVAYFEQGRITENTMLAKKWFTNLLGYDYVYEKLTTKISDNLESIRIEFGSEKDLKMLALGMALLEKGELNSYEEALVCREFGHFPELTVELLKRHPKLSCLRRTRAERNDGIVDRLGGQVSQTIEGLRTEFHVPGIPMVVAREEVYEGLESYLTDNSGDPLFKAKSPDGHSRSYEAFHVYVNNPAYYKK